MIMKMRKLIVLFLLALLGATISTSNATTWYTATTFTGASDVTTDYFFVPSAEWRISWECTSVEEPMFFGVTVYEKGETPRYITTISADESQTNGETYVHEGQPTNYYLEILVVNCDYEIQIEYKITTSTPTTKPTTNSNNGLDYNMILVLGVIGFLIIFVIAVRMNLRKNNLPPPPPP